MEQFIRTNYPDAEDGLELTKRCIGKLVNEHQFDLQKTILATSVCSDEIVRSATNFREYLDMRNPFQLGGLAGYPFTGLTGLKAFAAHIPDDGAALIQYGPHIGVSKHGEIGIMQRQGQMLETTCCGALQATLSQLSVQDEPTSDPDLDYQQWKLESHLFSKKKMILEHPVPLVAATDVMFGIIHNHIKVLLKASEPVLKGFRIGLIGGVIINTDHNLGDWFDLRHFEVLEF